MGICISDTKVGDQKLEIETVVQQKHAIALSSSQSSKGMGSLNIQYMRRLSTIKEMNESSLQQIETLNDSFQSDSVI